MPLAFITGYGSNTSWGANAHFTNIQLRDLHLYTYGVSAGALDRIELSYTRQQLDFTSTALDGLGVKQDVFGLKVKLLGDAIYGQDTWLPQLAVGAQYKHNDGIKHADAVGLPGLINPQQLGAQAEHSTDFYLALTKVFLGEEACSSTPWCARPRPTSSGCSALVATGTGAIPPSPKLQSPTC